MAHKHLKGLNTLRFIAAALVLMDHGRHHLNEMNINFGEKIPLFHKGIVAVNFFFTLSGFLISYLAFNEIKKEGHVNFKFFYIRRALRIMPLYYLVLLVSLILIGFIAPIFLNENKLGFPLLEGGALFFVMVPNLVKAIWLDTVGGLNILWSIGVEEQYYLLFPLLIFIIKKTHKKILTMCLISAVYFAFYWSVHFKVFELNRVAVFFIGTLKFHYMLVGIIFSLLCHRYYENQKFKDILNNNIVQIVIFTLALLKIFISPKINVILDDFLSTLIFASLIVVVSHRSTGKFFNVNIKILSYLGAISYGIYLLHPLVSYFVRFIVVKIDVVNKIVNSVPLLYIVILLLVTILVAHVSYNYFELKFLKLKKRFIS